jgi:UDP-N-acetylglucosamine 3-dehydrogenase
MKQIRCGVIGLGWFGEHHVDTLQQLPLVELRAVCTRTESRLKEVATRYNVPKAYTDYRELLADKDIDMVTIVTHVKDHLKPALAALAAGKHVFLEKPMADSVEECDQIIAAAAKAGTCFMVGHICRFDSVYALTKEEIAAGSLGTIISLHARRNLAKWITPSHLMKLSALFGDGVHDLDLMFWYTGAKPKTVYAQTMNTRPELPNDDVGWAMFRLDSGAIAVIEDVWCLPNNAPWAIDGRMEIIGTEGAIYINCGEAGLEIQDASGLKMPDTVYWPKPFGQRYGVLHAELRHFADCVLEGRKPDRITPEEARAAVALMEAATQSAQSGKVIELG